MWHFPGSHDFQDQGFFHKAVESSQGHMISKSWKSLLILPRVTWLPKNGIPHRTLPRITWLSKLVLFVTLRSSQGHMTSKSRVSNSPYDTSQDHMTFFLSEALKGFPGSHDLKKKKGFQQLSKSSQHHMTFKMRVNFTVIKEFTGSHDTPKVQEVLWFPIAHVPLSRITWHLHQFHQIFSRVTWLPNPSYFQQLAKSSQGHMTPKIQGVWWFPTAHVTLPRNSDDFQKLGILSKALKSS